MSEAMQRKIRKHCDALKEQSRIAQLKRSAAEEMYDALKAILEDNCFYRKAGDERAWRLLKEALAKADGK